MYVCPYVCPSIFQPLNITHKSCNASMTIERHLTLDWEVDGQQQQLEASIHTNMYVYVAFSVHVCSSAS